MVAVIASKRASPAARRLALRLIFGVFILGPSLQVEIDPWRTSE